MPCAGSWGRIDMKCATRCWYHTLIAIEGHGFSAFLFYLVDGEAKTGFEKVSG